MGFLNPEGDSPIGQANAAANANEAANIRAMLEAFSFSAQMPIQQYLELIRDKTKFEWLLAVYANNGVDLGFLEETPALRMPRLKVREDFDVRKLYPHSNLCGDDRPHTHGEGRNTYETGSSSSVVRENSTPSSKFFEPNKPGVGIRFTRFSPGSSVGEHWMDRVYVRMYAPDSAVITSDAGRSTVKMDPFSNFDDALEKSFEHPILFYYQLESRHHGVQANFLKHGRRHGHRF